MTFHTKLLWAQNHCLVEIDGIIKIYDRIKYLRLFCSGLD